MPIGFTYLIDSTEIGFNFRLFLHNPNNFNENQTQLLEVQGVVD